MTTLPEGDVKQWEAIRWVYDQAEHLTPTRHTVLVYLVAHAYYREQVGLVIPARATYVEIQRGTGLGRTTAYNALQGLFHAAYAYVDMAPSDKRENRVKVLWTEYWDRVRDNARRGIKPLPKEFQKTARGFAQGLREANISDLQEHRKRRSVGSAAE